VIQVLGHGDQVILRGSAGQSQKGTSGIPGYRTGRDPEIPLSAPFLKQHSVTHDVRFRRDQPLFVTYRLISWVIPLESHSHRFARPLTTSALFPINRSSPITFFRHVPILLNQPHPEHLLTSSAYRSAPPLSGSKQAHRYCLPRIRYSG
jgi:hypothetical protein